VEANLGDVILAGVGTGVLTWDDVKDWQVRDEKVMPDSNAHQLYNEYYGLYRSVYEHLKSDMAQINALVK
jgi:xylulokinase